MVSWGKWTLHWRARKRNRRRRRRAPPLSLTAARKAHARAPHRFFHMTY
jgi:hypothetical protein